MCGIAGVMYADDRPVDRRVLKSMADRIAHRGPDGEGYFVAAGIGLAHRRLSIIDLAGGGQPIANEDGSVQVVFNGEIYNYPVLRDDLERRGHRFRTRSDTEVLVHLYEELGDNLVQRLRGMFAFAIWDASRRRLVLARDRVGIKPLYVYRDAEKVLFGSELKAILGHPDVPRAIDPCALDDYLALGMIPGRRSIFRGIEKLLPGYTLTVSPGAGWQRPPQRYWQLRFEPDPRPTADEWMQAVRAKTVEAVQLHLIADVPVGTFLSGGIDSGVVTALAADAADEPPRTFSIGFAGDADSELPAARAVARRYGTRHVEDIVTPDAASLLDRLSLYYDEPFADSSALPTYLVSTLASRHVKVALTGDGGDEAFGGYARYAHDLREAAVRDRLPSSMRALLAPLAAVWPKADWLPRGLRLKTALTNLSLDPASAYANTVTLCRSPLRQQLVRPELRAALGDYDPGEAIRRAYREAQSHDPLTGMLAADTTTFLPDDFLVKTDRASMAVGVELRPPLLDHELLELAARIPSTWKVREGSTKWLFKQTFADVLPRGAISRPKRGFELPLDAWLRGPLADRFEATVLASRSPVAGWIDRGVARQLMQAHHGGRGRHGAVLWSLLVLAAWADRYLVAESVEPLPQPSRDFIEVHV